MKKIFTTLISGCALVTMLSAQVTFTDNFSGAKDYTTDGFDGSIWDGQVLNDEAVLTELNTTTNEGALTITAANTAWDDDVEGFVMYKNLAGANFDAKVKIVGGTFPSIGDNIFVGYFMPGLMVRASDAAQVTFCQVMAFDRYDWTAVFRHYNAPMAVDTNDTGSGDVIWTPRHKSLDDMGLDIADSLFTVGNYPWMRLVKEDGYVSSYFSADGSTWYEIWESDRADMDGLSLQVGLAHATFTTDTATVVFDDFSVYDPAATPSGVKENKTDKLLVYYKNNTESLYIKGLFGAEVTYVNLISIDGKVVKTETNFNNGEMLDVSAVPAGVYVVQTRLSDGSNYAQKVVIY